MKLKTFLIVGCLKVFSHLAPCTAPTNVKDYSAYVNPFIGTGGHGNTFPGAVDSPRDDSAHAGHRD